MNSSPLLPRFKKDSNLLNRLLLITCIFVASPGYSAAPQGRSDTNNFDARIQFSKTVRNAPVTATQNTVPRTRAASSNLKLETDSISGVTRAISNETGYVSEAQQGSPEAIALKYIVDNAALLGLSDEDVANFEITDEVFSAISGATRIYLRQTANGIPVYNGVLQINVNRDGRIISVNNAFSPNLAKIVTASKPNLAPATAIMSAANSIGLNAIQTPKVESQTGNFQLTTTLSANDISKDLITAGLMWLPVNARQVQLVWNFQIRTLDDKHQYDFNIDASNGDVWTRFDWVNSATFRVFPQPVESPNHAVATPPEDGRTIATDVADAVASPNGWFDDGTARTITRGNNANAYEDSNGTDGPSSGQPNCGVALDCQFDFPIDFGAQQPPSYKDAAVTNLFYWNNIIHDIQYQYGFDEAGGNFQEQNFANGGIGSDAVQAEAQDGSGTCNANFGTPPDGSNPTMQMYICNDVTPSVDGDFDSGVIIHEYGHGISTRLVGGPSNSSCLNNNQQPGEGLSDWWSMVYTAKAGDVGTDRRPMGTYFIGQPTNGSGIRPQPYSTNPAINNYTYESMNGLSIPHGVGSVWAQAAWEVYWALVNEHGFDANLYNAQGNAGNQRAMLYVNEGLKNTSCSPAFTDVRDGIIQAATDLHGGEDVCRVWQAFADFGLGTNAISGGASSTSPTNGFDVPAECECAQGETVPVANAGVDVGLLVSGQSATIGTAALPGHTYSWSPGGATTAQISVSPAVTTIYTVTVTTECASKSDSTVVAIGGYGLNEDFEGDVSGWTVTGLWHKSTSSNCPNPQPGYSSASNAFYFGSEASCNYDTGNTTQGNLVSPAIFGLDANSKLTFNYLRGVESFNGNFDITQVDILTDGGDTSATVFTRNASDASTSTWKASGDISLAVFADQVIQVRFRFNSVDNVSNAFLGWFIDDVVVTAAPQDTINSGEWTQLAIPCAPVAGENSLATLLGDDVTGDYGKDWIVFRYSIADGYSQVALNDALEQGAGYWFIHNNPQSNAAVIDMPASCSVTPITTSSACASASGCYDIPLQTKAGAPGWNMAGYPFTDQLAWDRLRIVDNASCVAGCTMTAAQSNNVFNNQGWHYDAANETYQQLSTGGLNRLFGFWSATLPAAVSPRLLIPVE